MRFLVDAQLPPALARLLCEQGHDAKPVRDVGLRNADDRQIWEFAKREGMAVITKDEDFAQRAMSNTGAPVIVWVRVGNTSNRALLRWFAPLLPKIVEAIQRGDRLLEII